MSAGQEDTKSIMPGGCVQPDPFRPADPLSISRYPLPDNYEKPFDVEHVFSYHVPTTEDIHKYEQIRTAAKALAYAIIDNTPACLDQKVALNNLRSAVMYANAAVALKGRHSR